MYEGPLAKALKEAYPARASYRILEDNDPSGYQCKVAKAAKEDNKKIVQFEIPKRSPDLNVMDYYMWAPIEKKFRE